MKKNTIVSICRKFITTSARFCYKSIKPRSNNKERQTREFILNIILVSLLTLIFLSFLSSIYYSLFNNNFSGNSPIYIGLIFTGVYLLYYLSRIGFHAFSSIATITLLFITATTGLMQWGINLPAPLLIYVLIILIAGILISSKFALLTTSILSLTVISISYMQAIQIITPNLEWSNTIKKMDGKTYGIIFFVILALTWLYNREIEKLLKRARKSEKALLKEKENLEIKVEERTRELAKEQKKRISELYHFYEFGQLSGGIFHDLVNRLQHVYLSVEKLNNKKKEKSKLPKNVQEIIDDASSSLENVKAYINAAQKQIKQEDTKTYYSIVQEIKDTIAISRYKAIQSGTEIYFNEPNSKIITFGNKFKLNQILTNIISNATDACSKIKNSNTPCSILIEAKKIDKQATITIQDTGVGIKEEILTKIFKPFYTTKKTMGLGLYTTKNIIEQDFKGKINIIPFPINRSGCYT